MKYDVSRASLWKIICDASLKIYHWDFFKNKNVVLYDRYEEVETSAWRRYGTYE